MSTTPGAEPPATYTEGGHFLLRLTYISRTKDSLSSQQLDDILRTARLKNQERGITGVLVFNRDFFLQCIEGSRASINGLLNALVKDDRHYDLQIVQAVEVDERHWGEWSMNYVSANASNQMDFLRYSSGKQFNPYLMKMSSIEKLLATLTEDQAPAIPGNAPAKPGILARLRIA